jgi:hypothetical protein
VFQARIVSSPCISAALALTFLIPVAAAAQATPNVVKNIVLVHGAFADGTSWSKVIPLLEAEGYQNQGCPPCGTARHRSRFAMGGASKAPQPTPRWSETLDGRREIRRTSRPETIMNQDYVDTVRLLLAVAPEVFRPPRFALKGGTALNLFVQDMPRLSVDIDVVFTDHTLDRETALKAIAADLKVSSPQFLRWVIERIYQPREAATRSS